MDIVYPKPLVAGDKVMVIAPSAPSNYLKPTIYEIADARFKELGLEIIYSDNFNNNEECGSSANIHARVADIHQAFADKNVAGILCGLGGFHANQLLPLLNWDLIRQNPKVFCGYSDITALNNAILARAGLVNFSGPLYFNFGMKYGFDFTLSAFKTAVMSDKDFIFDVSDKWSDDSWDNDQENRGFFENTGPQIFHHGVAKGRLIGGNISTVSLLCGTKFMPDFEDIILFIENDSLDDEPNVIRMLDGILMQDFSKHIRGIIVGRFQRANPVSFKRIYQSICRTHPNIPVVMGMDIGHTAPMLTVPVGVMCEMALNDTAQIKVLHR